MCFPPSGEEYAPKSVQVREGRKTVPNEPVVLIIDALPLRSLGLISILNRLGRLAISPQDSVALHTSDEVEPVARCGGEL